MKRKVTDACLREIVRARVTKGDAFRMDFAEYATRQDAVKAELANMTRTEIFAKYSYATYDLRSDLGDL